jgi:hypothetical protein
MKHLVSIILLILGLSTITSAKIYVDTLRIVFVDGHEITAITPRPDTMENQYFHMYLGPKGYKDYSKNLHEGDVVAVWHKPFSLHNCDHFVIQKLRHVEDIYQTESDNELDSDGAVQPQYDPACRPYQRPHPISDTSSSQHGYNASCSDCIRNIPTTTINEKSKIHARRRTQRKVL